MENTWHRHLGVYGICTTDNKLLIIHKNGGPYSGRYDLPGGSIEPNESILNTITREFIEETGISIRITKNLTTKDFIVPWTRDGYAHTHCHHIAVFYEVAYLSGNVSESPNIDDSLGAEWMNLEELNENNSSPLVMEAITWIRTGTNKLETIEYKEWNIIRK